MGHMKSVLICAKCGEIKSVEGCSIREAIQLVKNRAPQVVKDQVEEGCYICLQIETYGGVYCD